MTIWITGISNLKNPLISDGAKQGGFLLICPNPEILVDLLGKIGQKTLQNFRPPSAARWVRNKGGFIKGQSHSRIDPYA